jgi:hypothetical protein
VLEAATTNDALPNLQVVAASEQGESAKISSSSSGLCELAKRVTDELTGWKGLENFYPCV